MDLRIAVVESMPFAENTYIAWRPGRATVWSSTPASSRTRFWTCCAEKLIPAAILNTHGHVDHIAGNEAIKQAFPDLRC